MTVERCDVLIAGSGFGGSIAAYRLAEAYHAAGADPSAIVVLERGKRFGHKDFKQSMHVDNLSDIYRLVQGQGMQVVTANAVGGGSNLYLAASLRAPSETFERRDHRPDDGGDRRMWPAALSRQSLDPFYARAEHGLRVRRPTWNQVSRSGGLWAAALNASGHTCDRVPLAISAERCVDAKWCHTGCIFGAKNSLITNYLAAAEALGVTVRPLIEVQGIQQSSARPYRFIVSANAIDPDSRNATGTRQIECKVLILATGAMGDAPILLRSKPFLPALSAQVGKNVGCNGDHVGAIEFDSAKVRSVLGLPGYDDFYKGRPITTMTYDFWTGRGDHSYDGKRFTLQEIFLSSLTNFLYDDGRAPYGDPSWWGIQKKQAIANWAHRIELLAMVQDTHDGQFVVPSPTGGGAVQLGAGPIAFGTFAYEQSEQSIAVRQAANAAMQKVAEYRGLGRFMGLSETRGVYAAHPLGGVRMADDAGLGAVDADGRVYGYEGLHCFGSSIIPTSLGVNPSLTISAVAERCAQQLVRRAADYGLPVPPAGFAPQTPAEIVGPRVLPTHAPDAPKKRRRRRKPAHH